jgi:photosystem II stability/assembly factor-like uncharacterized protein
MGFDKATGILAYRVETMTRLRGRLFITGLALTALASPVSASWLPWGSPARPVMTLQFNRSRPDLLYGRVLIDSNFYSLWRSKDAGLTWRYVQPEFEQAISAFAVDPNNPEIVWALTAEDGLWRSRDAGDTWYRRTSGTDLGGGQVVQLLVDPRHSDALYFVYSGFNDDFDPVTWVCVCKEGQGSFNCGDFVANDFGNTVYTRERGRELVFFDEEGLEISRNDGLTWSLGSLPRHFGFQSGQAAPSAPSILYGVLDSQYQCLARSDDAGAHWRVLPNPAHLRDIFCDSLAVDPLDARHVWVSGQSGFNDHIHDVFLESHDSGESWSHPLPGPSGAVVATGGEVIYSGGVYHLGLDVSRDGGRTWTPSDRGISAGDLRYGLFAQPIPGGGPGRRVFALSDVDGVSLGAYRTDDGTNWQPLPLKNVIAIANGGGTAVVAVDERGVVVSRDSGESWQVSPSAPPINSLDYYHFSFSSDVMQPQYLALLDYETDNVTLGNVFFWTSDDGGGTWRRSIAGADTECYHVGGYDYCPDFRYAVDPFHPNRRWVAETHPIFGAVILRSEDAGASWNLAAPNLPDAFALAADPAVEGRLLAGTRRGLLLSEDSGTTWTPIGDLPDDAVVQQLSLDSRSSVWYAATMYHGIYRSLDAGAHWILLDGAPISRYSLIAIDPAEPGALFAALLGQGAWRWTP